MVYKPQPVGHLRDGRVVSIGSGNIVTWPDINMGEDIQTALEEKDGAFRNF
jgi:hypothetical protein